MQYLNSITTASKKSYIFLVLEISKRESGSESTEKINIIVKYNDSIPTINITILFSELKRIIVFNQETLNMFLIFPKPQGPHL